MNKNPRNIMWYKKQVKKLIEINKKSPPQKSPEWFSTRNTRITASSASSCLPKIKEICSTYENLFGVKIKYNPTQYLNNYETREEFIINKCREFYGENLFKDNVYTLHGKKFEEISTRLYRKVYNTKVLEFGLLPHPRLSWLAMSPDGCTESGILIEIKNPNKMYTIPSITYFTQMQIQMETANLDECDFLVCDIKNIDTEEEYITRIIDVSQNSSIPNSCKQYKGIILNNILESDNSTIKYIYPPDSLDTTDDFLIWKNNTILQYKQQGIELIPNYYVIQQWTITRIARNREWFNIIKPYLKNTMDIIKKLQSNKDLFLNYVESIENIKNKQYSEKYNNTFCLIDDTEDDENNNTFCLIDNTEDHENNCLSNDVENEKNLENDTCLIDD